MSDIIESFHVVLTTAGLQFYVDTDTRKEIEAFLRGEHGDVVLIVDSIVGEEITLLRGSVCAIYSSSPESRRDDRQIRKHVEAEEGAF